METVRLGQTDDRGQPVLCRGGARKGGGRQQGTDDGTGERGPHGTPPGLRDVLLERDAKLEDGSRAHRGRSSHDLAGAAGRESAWKPGETGGV